MQTSQDNKHKGDNRDDLSIQFKPNFGVMLHGHGQDTRLQYQILKNMHDAHVLQNMASR